MTFEPTENMNMHNQTKETVEDFKEFLNIPSSLDKSSMSVKVNANNSASPRHVSNDDLLSTLSSDEIEREKDNLWGEFVNEDIHYMKDIDSMSMESSPFPLFPKMEKIDLENLFNSDLSSNSTCSISGSNSMSMSDDDETIELFPSITFVNHTKCNSNSNTNNNKKRKRFDDGISSDDTASEVTMVMASESEADRKIVPVSPGSPSSGVPSSLVLTNKKKKKKMKPNSASSSSSISSAGSDTVKDSVVFATYAQHDVLLGKYGNYSIKHEGNVFYRNLLSTRKDKYDSGSRDVKTSITWSVISEVHDRGGRFLRKADISQGKHGWIEVNNVIARRKVSQAFRDLRKQKKNV